MPDITMCKNEECDQKDRCWRYKATPDLLYQSYFSDDIRNADGSCDEFWGD